MPFLTVLTIISASSSQRLRSGVPMTMDTVRSCSARRALVGQLVDDQAPPRRAHVTPVTLQWHLPSRLPHNRCHQIGVFSSSSIVASWVSCRVSRLICGLSGSSSGRFAGEPEIQFPVTGARETVTADEDPIFPGLVAILDINHPTARPTLNCSALCSFLAYPARSRTGGQSWGCPRSQVGIAEVTCVMIQASRRNRLDSP